MKQIPGLAKLAGDLGMREMKKKTGMAEGSKGKRSLALLLALRSLCRIGTDPGRASVPDQKLPEQMMSGTLTINPDWTVNLAVKIHGPSGNIVRGYKLTGFLVSEKSTVDVRFHSGQE